jgi:2-polyprenyl-3-methyl-5-hydroxy-6-metoxy-1,4-benzoquinol methylase
MMKRGFLKKWVLRSYLKSIKIRFLFTLIGCGGGYFLNRASSFFDEIIGIEPSKAALDSAVAINKGINITYINKSMIEGMELVPKDKPYLITTSAVLSHITDKHVIEFLTYLN